ncbi:lycopene beta-cyclase [Rhodoglobus vestalii]|uniref:Lycopene beta-cyclase n=1 Tax=Rhodoglobus vestalii TaxID=193384 RepID=A0A8H2PUU0_9MICO|nr:lycopene cyclase family protein [Rhodoglobus vestalii]TQO20092.1 lycopene beta-cyclase [Rhodoglobus vestalii]
MSHDVEVDLVILGAGCAGLSLAARLADAGTSLRVMAIEARADYVDDRSWCFWRPDDHPLARLVSTTWRSWTFSGVDGRSATRSVPGMSYQYIRGSDFYTDAMARIAASPQVTVHMATPVDGLEAVPGGVRLTTHSGTVTARWVVDTRPVRRPAMLYQCFVGVELESATPLPFARDEAGLMTSMRADAAGLAFTYLLPISSTRALVEWTRFSAQPLPESELRAGLDETLERLSLGNVPVVRTERGVLPMGRPPGTTPSLPGVVHAGVAGGALRATSGYAFLRIQRWAESCAQALLAGQAPVGHPAEPWARREMDRIFLQAVCAHPEKTADYFLSMAQRVAPQRFVRFLSDEATTSDYVSIIASLPFIPFLRELRPRPELFRGAE